MLVEYSFITTLEARDAMRVASDFLTSRGFVAEASGAFALDGGDWNALEVRREKRTGKARTQTAVDLPQVIRLEWDRGRVTLAALSLQLPSFNTAVSSAPRGNRTESEQRQLLWAITQSMMLVVGAQQPDQGAAEWDRVEQEIVAQAIAKRKGVKPLVIILGILAVIAVIIAIVGVATSPRY
jgi:hypothetical protein